MSWIILLLAGCLIPNDARAEQLEHGTLIKEFPQGRPPQENAVHNAILASGDDHGRNHPNIERVEGSLVAKDQPEKINPKEKLETGSLVGKFEQPPQRQEVQRAIARSGRGTPRMMGDVEKVSGNVLDEDVQKGTYVPNPTKVLSELLYDPKHLDELQAHSRHGEHVLDVVEGEVVAGDPTTLDVVDVNGDFADHLQKHIESRVKHHLPEHMSDDGEHVPNHPGRHFETGGKSSSEETKPILQRRRESISGGGSSSSEEGGISSSEEGPMTGPRGGDDDFRRPRGGDDPFRNPGGYKDDDDFRKPRGGDDPFRNPNTRWNCQSTGDSCSTSIAGHCCSGSCNCPGDGSMACCCGC